MATLLQRVERLLQLRVLEGGQQGLHVREAGPSRACLRDLRGVGCQGRRRAAGLHGRRQS